MSAPVTPARLVAGSVAFAGTRDASCSAGTAQVSWREFLWHWHTEFEARPVTARQAWECARLGLHAGPHGLRFPFPTGQPPRVSPGVAPVRSLGRWLTGQIDVWHEDIMLRSALLTTRRRLYWTTTRQTDRTPPHPGS